MLIVVTDSARFTKTANSDQDLTVVDVSAGAAKVLGKVLAGSFPRELAMMPDGRTLLVTNFNSSTLEFVDIPPDTPAKH